METEIDHILLLTTSTYKNYDLSRFRDINVGLYSSDLIFHIFMKSAVKTSTIDNALTSGISSYDSNAILSLLSISYVTVVSNKGLKYPSTPRMPTAPTYTSADCTSFEFTCESSRCISSTQQCNGYSECMDMSDEDWRRCYDCQPVTINACTNVLPYTSAYFPNKVVTTQEMATNMLSKIEDYLHCHEYATLFACLTYAPSCPSDAGFIQRPCRLFCYSVLYSCLNVLRELAIQFSCSDLDNNAGCWQPQSGTCDVMEFRCNDGRCIHVSGKCDGANDCWDESDEDNCNYHDGDCNEFQYRCNDNSKCIPLGWRCDDTNDCPDASDEADCYQTSTRCSYSEFTCANRTCIPISKRCDSNNDCGDNSDETVALCGSVCPDDGEQMSCSNVHKCVMKTQECDDNKDCPDNSDESKCVKMFGSMLYAKYNASWIPICANGWYNAYSRVVCQQLGFGNVSKTYYYTNDGFDKSATLRPSVTVNDLKNIRNALEVRIVDIVDISSIKAVMGIKYTNSYVSSKQTRTISTFYIHPEYNYRTYVNDIALLKLTSPVTYTDRVRPACIALEDIVLPAGRLGYIAGWGITEEDAEEVSTILQEAHVPLVALEECAGLLNIELHPGMQCAGYLTGGIDTCQGDSGGPLMIENTDDGRWYLYGVTSFGYGCARANMPGIYTKVNKYTDFLEEIIGF
ncbi:atrial natriuretic peptide-converting enzyme-like [Saccoglossus kowalevskii]